MFIVHRALSRLLTRAVFFVFNTCISTHTRANITLTVTPSDTIHFTGDITLYAKATHHQEAITAIQNAAKTLCDVTHPPLQNTVDDALTGTVDNDIDNLRYELTYNTETKTFTNT